MKLIVDSNILFTFFWKNSVFQKLSLKQDLELLSPEYALEEINKYSSEILKKTNLSKKEFNELRRELAVRVEFIPVEEYASLFKSAVMLAKNLSEKEQLEFLDDIDFIALALKSRCPLWSHDKLLRKQQGMKVLTTKEVITLIE